MSSHGTQAGGIVGFLNSLRYLVELVGPSETYVCWEAGGSLRRRNIFPGYKKNRKPPRLNRYYGDEIPDTQENRVQQTKALIQILQHTPVCQIYVEDCEADDVIGYLSRNTFNDKKKIIASADKDFYQLLDDNTTIFSWTKKIFIGPSDVIKEYGITAENFVTAKAICGDKSDNIPGVQGAGFKTLSKRFPELGTSKEVTVTDIINETKKRPNTRLKIIKNICSNELLIKRNWKLMYLDVSNLAAIQIRRIDAAVNREKSQGKKLDLMRALHKEGLPTFDVQELWNAFVDATRV